ncbi:MarR family transcriptional regulator [Altererythrobacter sp. CC-YST694]|uniref:MarR family winged helix-turn-helix transcriptional regulator n=1 Tax=Altererythrobacter sp. CC-YST694 TaxID=2755038 RepID=UPI001D01DAD8|nr:MarR family transcriptional regulator [Altererythrobacter sp. CC-YST694]MCB5426415.1 MarR family transcriptional regulator [Altererythrobacter sp. CC-YST694]
MKRGKKARTAQQRGPLPPRKARARNGPRSLKGLLFGGFELDMSDRHLENFHRLSPESPEDDTYFRFTRALVVAARRWRKVANDQIRPLDQTMVRWETLYLVAYSGEELTQSELARVVGVEGPTMVRMLHLLAEEGLLERHQSRDDLRVTINRITEKGRKVIADIMSITNQLRREMLDGIGAEDLAVAQKVLTRMVRNLEEVQAGRRSPAVRTGEEETKEG